MNHLKRETNAPFSVIAGQGLGASYSSLEQIGSMYGEAPFGSAGIQSIVNAATGNVCVRDRVLKYPDIGGAVAFSYVYNSMSSESGWNLAFARTIKSVIPNQKLVVTESDGRNIEYTFDHEKNAYVADPSDDGRPSITWDSTSNHYQWHHPHTKVTEYFDPSFRIQKRVDKDGNETSFEYHNDGKLKAIIAPSKIRYEFEYTNNEIKVYRNEDIRLLIHTYVINQDGSLSKSITSDQYEINYHYNSDKKLDKISQSDKTELNFEYYCHGEHQGKLNKVVSGTDTNNLHTFKYHNNQTDIIDPAGKMTSINMDEKQQPSSMKMGSDNKQFLWNERNQIKKVIYPDSSFELHDYDVNGLLTRYTRRDGSSIEYVYSNEKPSVLLQKLEFSPNSASPVSRLDYVYDKSGKDGHPVLRFVVTGEGRVKEFECDECGQIKRQREYLKDPFKRNNEPVKPLSLDELNAWRSSVVSNNGFENTALTEYQYDVAGNLQKKVQYASVLASGEGHHENKVIEELYEHDINGNIIENSKSFRDGSVLTNTAMYDSLNRCSMEQNGVGTKDICITRHQYDGNKVTTTQPNHRTEMVTSNASGELESLVVEAEKKKRQQKSERSLQDNAEIKTHCDGGKSYQFYDEQQRLIMSVSKSGLVTNYQYDDVNRWKCETTYATFIDIKQFDGSVRSLEKWISEHKPSTEENRTNYTVYGYRDEPKVAIDALGYITAYKYNTQGKMVQVIRYADKITAEEQHRLLNGGELNREPNRLTDQVNSTFYDRDGFVTAEQDGDGYITKMTRDAVGNITEKVKYNTPCLTISESFDDLNITTDAEQDAKSYYYYNALGQCVMEVDAEGYITEHSYTLDGKIESEIRYYQQVNQDWYRDTSKKPCPGKDQHNDRTKQFEYDQLRRLEKVTESTGLVTVYEYNEMNQQNGCRKYDSKHPDKTDGDYLRAEYSCHNEWGEKTVAANAFVSQLLTKADAALSPEQAAKKKLSIWLEHASHFEHDDNGLLVRSKDSLGHSTIYYYDANHNPVFVVDPTGAVKEFVYSAFGEVIEETGYYERLTAAQIASLSGGRACDEVKCFIKPNLAKDHRIHYKRDARGQIIAKTYSHKDGEVSSYHYQYDFLKRCKQERWPIVDGKSVAIDHGYDHRNHETKTVKTDAAGHEIVKSAKYDNCHGLKSAVTDANQCTNKIKYDRLGNAVEESVVGENDDDIAIKSVKYDAYTRPISKTNADKNTAEIEYRDDERTTVIKHADKISVTVMTKNVFDETVDTIVKENDNDTIISKNTITHAPDGQIESKTNGSGQTTTNLFDLNGKGKGIMHADQTRTEIKRNAAGQITDITEDAGEDGLNLNTHTDPDAFGNNEVVRDARGIETHCEFDRLSNMVKSTLKMQDGQPDRIKQQSFDALSNIKKCIQGDSQEINRKETDFGYDNSHRQNAVIVDPDGLDIKTEVEHDDVGNVRKESDANGNVTLKYYNRLNQLRFIVKSINGEMGSLSEMRYTASGKLTETRCYDQPVKLNEFGDNITFDKVKKLANKSPNDRVTYHFYDKNGHEKYLIEQYYSVVDKCLKGRITETVSDAIGRVKSKTGYANELTIDDVAALTTESIALQLKEEKYANHLNNRSNYYLYDAASNERFVIDADGYVTEKVFDSAGRVIEKYEYAQPVENVAEFVKKSLKEAEKAVESLRNYSRKSYHVYDAAGREIFAVNPVGLVLRKDYDKNGNKIQSCRFKNAISVSDSYQQIVTLLNKLVPNENVDSIKRYKYDNANSLISKSDELGFEETYKRDGLGNAIEVTKRNKQVWKHQYDRAQRHTDEISPLTTIAVVKQDGSTGKLSHEEVRKNIVRKMEHDKVGNTTKITLAHGIDKDTDVKIKPRDIAMKYDANKNLVSTEVKDVKFEDADHVVKTEDIKTSILYNVHGQKIAECNEAGIWDFYIYNSSGHLEYKINKQESLVYYKQNAFGQNEEIFKYDNKLEIDDWAIFKDPAQCLNALLMLNSHPRTEGGRLKQIKYHRRGGVESVKTSSAAYYDDGKWGFAEPEQLQQYNAFGDLTYTAQLVSPGKWAETGSWYDDNGKLIFEINANRNVTLYVRDTFGRISLRIEYANPIDNHTVTELLKLPVEDGLKLIKLDSEKDRVYEYIYDQRGDCIEERLHDVTYQQIAQNEKGIPFLTDLHCEYSSKKREYSPTRKMMKVTHENGADENTYYDERDIKIAIEAVKRTQFTPGAADVLLAPLVRLKPDAFGDAVVEQTSPNGSHLNSENLPEFDTDAIVYETLKLNDQRGLTTVKQDGRGNQTDTTFTKTKKPATTTTMTTVWIKNANNTFETRKRKYQERNSYNKADQPAQIDIMEDDAVKQSTFMAYNIFGDYLGEGDTLDKLIYLQRFDQSGNAWFSIGKGGSRMIHLRNLLGHETGQLSSGDVDLMQYTQHQIPELLAMDRAVVWLNVFERDLSGRLIANRRPIWYRNNDPHRLPTRTYIHDRWDNTVKEVDSKGNETDYVFDRRNLKVMEILPLENAMMDDLSIVKARQTRKYGYSLPDVLAGTIDGRGHCEGYNVDQAGQMFAHIAADGTVIERRVLDALGRPFSIYNALGGKEQYDFDANNNVIKLTHATGPYFAYQYNESDERIMIATPLGTIYRMNYNATHDMVERYMHLGQCTTTKYDRNKQQLFVGYADGTSLEWNRDGYGNPVWHRDIGSRIYDYQYDHDFRLKHQAASGGVSRSQMRLIHGRTYLDIKNISDYQLDYSVGPVTQDIQNEYLFGLLAKTTDTGVMKDSTWQYDDDENKEEMTIRSLYDNRTLRHVTTQRDALKRERKTIDEYLVFNGVMAKGEVDTLYDLVNNITNKNIIFTHPRFNPGCQQVVIQHNYMNAFDAADRAIVVGGMNINGVVQPTNGAGVQFGYANGVRTSETSVTSEGAIRRADLVWDGEKRIYDIRTNTGFHRAIIRNRAGWADFVVDEAPDGSFKKNHYLYDANEWLTDDTLFDSRAASHMPDKLYIHSHYTMTNIGTPANVHSAINVDHATTEDDISINYIGGESLYPDAVTGRRHNRYGGSAGDGKNIYDSNFNMSAKMGAEDEPLLSTRMDYGPIHIAYFDTTTNGLMLGKYYLAFKTFEVGKVVAYPYYTDQNIMNVDGVPHASYRANGNILMQAFDYGNHTRPNEFKHYDVPIEGFTLHSNTKPAALYAYDQGECNPCSEESNRQQISSGLKEYYVMPGDTLESIAHSAYGNSDLAYQIALHNGLIMNRKVPAGLRLILPDIIPNTIKANINRPYHEFINIMTGKVMPHLDMPLPKQDHPGFLGTLAKVIAIAIILAVAPELAGLMFAGGIGLAAATAVIAGIGDAAVQGLAIKFHIQEKFSINEVIETAVSAGALSGGPLALQEGSALPTLASNVLRAATTQVSTQLVEMGLGTRSKFDMNAAGIQVAAMLAAQQAQSKLKSMKVDRSTTAGSIAVNATNSVVSEAVYSAATHTPMNLQNMAANTLGGIAGDTAHDGLAKLNRQQKSHERNELKVRARSAKSAGRDFNENFNRLDIPSGGLDLSSENINSQMAAFKMQSHAAAPDKAGSVAKSGFFGNTVQRTKTELELMSQLTQGTLAGGILKDASNMYNIAHGNRVERMQAVTAIGEEVAIGVGAGLTAGLVVEAVAASRLAEGFGIFRVAKVGVEGERVLTPVEQLHVALTDSKIYESINQINADSPNAAIALRRKLSILQDFQNNADKVETLSNGSIRYYDAFRSAKTVGPTAGSRFVTEYNSITGDVASWNETYDLLGNVNRIHIKSINGVEINSPHFPLTLQERLEFGGSNFQFKPNF